MSQYDTAGAIGWRQRFPVNYSRSGYDEWSTIYCDDRAHLEEATEEARAHGFQVELIYGSSSATPPAPSVAEIGEVRANNLLRNWKNGK